MEVEIKIAVIVCLLASSVLVLSELRNWPIRRAIFKVIASSAFIVVAIELNPMASSYGRLILAALVFSWVGDVLLLSRQKRIFLFGIASFLVSHIVFSIAFANRPLNDTALIAGFAVMSVVGIIVLRWLWRHLSGFYQVAVTAYVVAIVGMCSFAIAVCAASGNWILAIGALAFAASDISVARDRFVAQGFINRAWGLPLYYAAQIVLALSIGGVYMSAV
ncbi:MAG: lysoplasmalogenase [Arenimonas sp.]